MSAQATKEKIAAKQAAAEIKRNEAIEKRKEAGNKESRSRNRIAEARAFAKTQIETSTEQKMEETKQRKMKQQQKIEKQRKLKENYAKKVKDRVSLCQLSYLALYSNIKTYNILFRGLFKEKYILRLLEKREHKKKKFSNTFLSYFEKNSSLVGVKFGLCIYVSMYVCTYVCMYLSMYWVMSHQSD